MDANSSRGAPTAEEMQMLAAIHQMATAVLQHVAARGLMSPWFPSAPPPAFGPGALTGRWAEAPPVWGTPFPAGPPGMNPLAPAFLPPQVHWAMPSWPLPPWAGGTWPAAPWAMARWGGLG